MKTIIKTILSLAISFMSVQGFAQSYSMSDGGSAYWSALGGYSDIYVKNGTIEADVNYIESTNFHLTGGSLEFKAYSILTLENNTFRGTGDLLFNNYSMHDIYLTNNIFDVKGVIEINLFNSSAYAVFDTSANYFSADSSILVTNGNAEFRLGEFVLDLDSFFNELEEGVSFGEWVLVSVDNGNLYWNDMDISTISGSFVQNAENENIYTYEDSNGIWTIEITDNEVILSFSNIPEPAEIAALIGALALGFVAYRRRK
jgi:PEP-CTERM putative exosortase interaction domain